jgi:hypothetical protein
MGCSSALLAPEPQEMVVIKLKVKKSEINFMELKQV